MKPEDSIEDDEYSQSLDALARSLEQGEESSAIDAEQGEEIVFDSGVPVKPALFPLLKNNKTGEQGRLMLQQDVVKAFAVTHRDFLRYDADGKRWLVFTGAAWTGVNPFQAIKPFLDRLKVGFDTGQRGKLMAVRYAEEIERSARSEPEFHTTSSMWDTDPDALGTPGGVIDLKAGETRHATAKDLIRNRTAVAPSATVDCPTWLRCLRDWFVDDETISFVQRFLGYSLTGHNRDHEFLYLHGAGGDGKSLMIEAVARVMGSYAAKIAIETLIEQRSERHLSEIAVLNGKRFAYASEPPEGFQWNERRIKELTGDSTIKANLMRQDHVEIARRFKLAILANPEPSFRDKGRSMERRLRPIKFPPIPEERVDDTLKDRLWAEAPGILRWLIVGAADWYADGLRAPEAIRAAAKAAIRDTDTLAEWIGERCTRTGTATHRHLWADWSAWAKDHGHEPRSGTWLTRELKKLKGVSHRMSNGSVFDGIDIR